MGSQEIWIFGMAAATTPSFAITIVALLNRGRHSAALKRKDAAYADIIKLLVEEVAR